METNQDIIHFVKGMAVHDIAKPLFLGGPPHSLAGFIVMSALNYPDEALAAFLHHNVVEAGDTTPVVVKNLRLFFGLGSVDKLSSLYLLAGSIDQLAATAYEVAEELSRKELNEPLQSCQNPFSRLPKKDERVGKLKIPKKGVKLDILFQKDFGELNKGILADLEKATGNANAHELAKALSSVKSLLKSDPKVRESLQDRLKRYQLLFPERTYPVPNDTVLKNHCRLTAALAFVICSNLVANDSTEFLQKKIYMQDGEVVLDGEEVNKFIDRTEPAFSKVEKIVRDNSDCFVLQVSLSGYENLIDNASSLDDLHGAIALIEEMKKRVKRCFARELGVEDLQEEICPSETIYDLIYLLPACIPLETIEEKLDQAHLSAVNEMMKQELMPKLISDFKTVNAHKYFSGREDELASQLRQIPLQIQLAKVASDKSTRCFNDFKKEFANDLLKSYGGLISSPQYGTKLSYKGVIPRLEEKMEVLAGTTLAAEDVCEVCGQNLAYAEFCELRRTNEELQKIIGLYRGEPEKICIRCIATRILSHGAVQIQWLNKLIEENPSGAVRFVAKEGYPDLPASMLQSKRLTDQTPYLDFEGAFVRRSNRRESPFDIFPTIAFAADENSNVAMIDIRPNIKKLFGDYKPKRIASWFPPLTESMSKPKMEKIERALTNAEKLLKREIPDANPGSTLWDTILSGDQKRLAEIDLTSIIQQLRNLSGDIHISEQERDWIRALIKAFSELIEFSKLGVMELTEQRIAEMVEVVSPSIRIIPHLTKFVDWEDINEYYTEVYNRAKSTKYEEQVGTAKAHIARVWQRIDQIDSFFRCLRKRLEEEGIRVLPFLEKYPRCLLAVPADRIADSLNKVYISIAKDLLSSEFCDEEGLKAMASIELLNHIVPKLLFCSAVIFKKKQPLYMILSISDNIHRRLQELEEMDLENSWSVVNFGFADARGALSEKIALLATSNFADLWTVLKLAEGSDRISLAPVVSLNQQFPGWDKGDIQTVAQAKLRLRGRRKGWKEQQIELLQKEGYFQPVLFLVTTERR